MRRAAPPPEVHFECAAMRAEQAQRAVVLAYHGVGLWHTAGYFWTLVVVHLLFATKRA